jgi:hypothetical protein
MFGVGLHFSLDDLLSVKKIALPGAVVQIAVATAMGMALTRWWRGSLMAGIVFGLALSVARTVVMLKALESHIMLVGYRRDIVRAGSAAPSRPPPLSPADPPLRAGYDAPAHCAVRAGTSRAFRAA